MPISVRKPPSFPAVAAPLRAIVADTLALEGLRAGEVTVVLTDDTALRDLNRRWRGIDRATDVLSFGDDRRGDRVNGDLVVSFDRVSAQARRYRTSAGRELARLVVHGTLHLAGHDHHRAAERATMRRCERTALRASAAAIRSLERAVR